MANTNSPFGFVPVGRLGGGPLSGAPSERKIAYNNATKIHRGDPVETLSTGYIARGAAGETGHLTVGIFLGCEYFSTAQSKWIWSAYWPGSDTALDAKALIVDDPQATFKVQSSGTVITLADIGANADFTLGTASDRFGTSGASLDQSTLNTTATLPFRIIGLVEGVGNGTDHTSSYNHVIVCWNDQFLRQMTGI